MAACSARRSPADRLTLARSTFGLNWIPVGHDDVFTAAANPKTPAAANCCQIGGGPGKFFHRHELEPIDFLGQRLSAHDPERTLHPDSGASRISLIRKKLINIAQRDTAHRRKMRRGNESLSNTQVRGDWNGRSAMRLIIYFIAITLAANVATYFIGLLVEHWLGSAVSLIVFLTLYFLSIWMAWVLAVRLTVPKLVAAE